MRFLTTDPVHFGFVPSLREAASVLRYLRLPVRRSLHPSGGPEVHPNARKRHYINANTVCPLVHPSVHPSVPSSLCSSILSSLEWTKINENQWKSMKINANESRRVYRYNDTLAY